MAAPYVSMFLQAVQQLALEPLLGPHPQAHKLTELPSSAAYGVLLPGLITGQCISLLPKKKRPTNLAGPISPPTTRGTPELRDETHVAAQAPEMEPYKGGQITHSRRKKNTDWADAGVPFPRWGGPPERKCHLAYMA